MASDVRKHHNRTKTQILTSRKGEGCCLFATNYILNEVFLAAATPRMTICAFKLNRSFCVDVL